MNLYEMIKVNANTNDTNYIELDLKDAMTEEIISSVLGQLSDGMWENSPAMKKYWEGARFKGGKLHLDRNINAIAYKNEEEINQFFANKIKQIVKQEIKDFPETGDWSRENENVLKYMGGHNIKDVRVKDAYKVYDDLLGRMTRVQDSEENTNINTSINTLLPKLREEFWDTMDTDEDIEDVAYENLYADIDKYINEKGLKNRYNPTALEIFKENVKKWVLSEDSIEEFNPMSSIQDSEENTDNLTFDTLSEDQKRELKERYYTEKNENVSWGELADIDNLVSDEELRKEYGDVSFVKDDFFTETEEEIIEPNESNYELYIQPNEVDEASYERIAEITEGYNSITLFGNAGRYWIEVSKKVSNDEWSSENEYDIEWFSKDMNPETIRDYMDDEWNSLFEKALVETEEKRNNLKIVQEVVDAFNKGTDDKYDLAVRTEEEGTIIIYDKYENFSYEYFDTEYFDIEDFENDFDDLQNTLAAALKKSLYLEEQRPCIYQIAIDTPEGSETLKETSEEEKVEVHDKMQDEYNKIFGLKEGALAKDDNLYIKIDTSRDGYNPSQVSNTLTVGQLIDELNQYDDDAKVFLSFDNDYTYGGIDSGSINEVIVDNEELEETEKNISADMDPNALTRIMQKELNAFCKKIDTSLYDDYEIAKMFKSKAFEKFKDEYNGNALFNITYGETHPFEVTLELFPR